MFGHKTYLFINFISVIIPLLFSFNKKVAFYKNWKYLFPGIALTGAFFLVWDVWFTHAGVWSFNAEYLTGIKIFNLPIEEVLFFVTIPYAAVFTYECYNAYFPKQNFIKDPMKVTVALAWFLLVFAVLNYYRIYTFYNCMFCSVFLQFHVYFLQGKYLGKFYISFLIVIIPFLIVKYFITSLPIVTYNQTQYFGIDLFSIPMEDFVYGMLNILGVVTVMEELKKKEAEERLSVSTIV